MMSGCSKSCYMSTWLSPHRMRGGLPTIYYLCHLLVASRLRCSSERPTLQSASKRPFATLQRVTSAGSFLVSTVGPAHPTHHYRYLLPLIVYTALDAVAMLPRVHHVQQYIMEELGNHFAPLWRSSSWHH